MSEPSRGAKRRAARSSSVDREDAEIVHVVAQRAIRRLDMLEWVMFLGGALLASLGGLLIAWMLVATSGWDFRSTWIGASLLLFVVPGSIAVARIRREERAHALQTDGKRKRDDG